MINDKDLSKGVSFESQTSLDQAGRAQITKSDSQELDRDMSLIGQAVL